MSKSDTNYTFSEQHFEQWRQFLQRAYTDVEINRGHGDGFFGGVNLHSLGRIDISTIHSCSQYVRCDACHSGTVKPDYFFVLVQTEGRCSIEQDDRKVTIKEGNWTVVDTSRTYQLNFDDRFKQVVLSIPHTVLPSFTCQSDRFTGRELSSLLTLGAVVPDYLSLLEKHMHTVPMDSRQQISESVLNLLSGSLQELFGNKTAKFSFANSQIKRIKWFIHQHLREPGLSVGFIADKMEISKRYVHKLFESEGTTVTKYILKLRLQHCENELLNEREKKITDIAFSWGFNSSAHFSYLFHKQYQMSARDYRRLHIN